jgi:hypothetical protein
MRSRSPFGEEVQASSVVHVVTILMERWFDTHLWLDGRAVTTRNRRVWVLLVPAVGFS